MTLTLFRGPNAWCARFSDPSIQTLFGTDTLPTAFALEASTDEVLRCIAERHPHYRIVIEPDHVTLSPPSTVAP